MEEVVRSLRTGNMLLASVEPLTVLFLFSAGGTQLTTSFQIGVQVNCGSPSRMQKTRGASKRYVKSEVPTSLLQRHRQSGRQVGKACHANLAHKLRV